MSEKAQVHAKEIASLLRLVKNADELRLFLLDLMTEREIRDLAERWRIIEFLIEGKTQREVKSLVGTSISTVTRGAKALKESRGGFQMVYKRLKEQ